MPEMPAFPLCRQLSGARRSLPLKARKGSWATMLLQSLGGCCLPHHHSGRPKLTTKNFLPLNVTLTGRIASIALQSVMNWLRLIPFFSRLTAQCGDLVARDDQRTHSACLEYTRKPHVLKAEAFPRYPWKKISREESWATKNQLSHTQ